MITYTELRIGNWVNLGDIPNQFIIVESVHKDGINLVDDENDEGNFVSYLDYSLEQIFPIPLTPEILESCGFKTNEAGETFILCRTSFKNDSMGWLKYILTNGISFERYNFEDETFFEHIKYLHQFQNFYFAFTGEELPVNLESKSLGTELSGTI